MDINQSLSSNKTSSVANTHIQSLSLKLTQQLDVKIISASIETQTISLQIAQPKRTIQVQSNIPINLTPGQTLKLEVTKLTPTAEFKVISADINKQINLKALLLKQIILQNGKVNKSQTNAKSPESSSTVISAKIISITSNKVLLDLGQSQQTNLKVNLQNQSTIIQLPIEKLPQKHTAGDKIQLEVSKNGTEINVKTIDSKLSSYKKGQFISATISNIKDNKFQIQLANSRHLITLNKNQLSYSPKSNLQAVNYQHLKTGQPVTLEVISTGNSPTFKLVENRLNSDQLLHNTLKQNLPNQQQSSVLLNQLIQFLPNINKNINISDTLKHLAKDILENLSQVNIKKPGHLKTAINDSGVFLEAKLAKTDEQTNLTIHPDLKSKLLKFNHALKNTLASSEQKLTTNEHNLLKEILQKSENSLAKVIINQLASLPKEDGAKQVWILDLPFLNKEVAESVEIIIIQDQQGKDNNHHQNWAVTITISPPNLGTIHCKVSCFDQTINTRFWSDNQEVVTKIKHNLDYLKSQFESAGIQTGHMSAKSGPPPPEAQQPISSLRASLVNQKV